MSDSSDISSSEDEEEEVPEKPIKASKRPVDEEIDDDDDSEDNSEEDSDVEVRPRLPSKRRKKAVNAREFLLDEAEVDNEGEEEDEDYDEEDADILPREDEEVQDWGPNAREIDSRRRLDDLLEQNEEEINRYYKDRYEEDDVEDRFGGGIEMADAITQQGLLPGVKDPNLWLVKCRLGEEKMAVLALMRKMIAHQCTDTPLQIKSAFCKEGLKGYVYMEAYKETHVKQALDGIGSLAMGRWKQEMVPINEMTDVMRVVKEIARLKKGQWVRMRRTVFKDDLAQVRYVDDAQNLVELKLIPRIDYTKKRGVLRQSGSSDNKDEDGNKRKTKRPAQALFSPEKIREMGGEVLTEGPYMVFERNRYDSKGFLVKTFNLNAILVDGVKPTLSEMEKFSENPETVQIDAAMRKGPGEVEHSLSPGDVVEVVDGELKNLQGRVISIDGNQITVQPTHTDLKEPIAFQSTELRKFFEPGKHVKVIAGRYEGDTGLVIRVESNVAILLSDMTTSDIKVATKDLQLCQERATGVDSTGRFQFGDLIEVDPRTVGVIVRLEKEHLEVLTMHSKVIRMKQNAVIRRRDNRSALAWDCEHNTIQKKDMVQVIDGPHAQQQGEIRHLYRAWAFVYSRMNTTNGGLFVARTRHLVLRGSGGANKTKMAGGGSGYAPQSPMLLSSPAHPSSGGGGPPSLASPGQSPGQGGGFRAQGGGGGGGGRGRGQRREDREMIGKTVRVIRGNLKGSIGIVKDATETECSVELHYPYKTVLVKKENLAAIDASGRIVGARFGASSGRQTPSYADRTPMHPGQQTPNYSSRTPMYGSQTPVHDGSRTPHYGSQTPRHDGGGMTPRSMAFDPAGATPAHSGMGSGGYDDIYDASPASNNLSSPAGSGSMPMGQAYTPQTPAGALMGTAGSSPLSSSPASVMTPTGSNYDTYQASPGNIFSPMGSVDPAFTPETPGAAEVSGNQVTRSDAELLRPEWILENNFVLVPVDEILKKAMVKGVTDTTVSVLIPDEKRVTSVRLDEVYRLDPEAGDKVRIMADVHNILEGQCLSVEEGDGVIKLNTEGALKLMELKSLVPYFDPGQND